MNTADSQSQGDGQSRQEGAGRECCPVLGTGLGVGGAVVGGVVGYWLFMVIARQGFYALVLPGALIGIGCGALSGRKSTALGIVCGVLGLAAGILAEWRFAPFIADESLSYFLSHLGELTRLTQVLIILGGVFAFYFGRGRQGGACLRRQKPTTD